MRRVGGEKHGCSGCCSMLFHGAWLLMRRCAIRSACAMWSAPALGAPNPPGSPFGHTPHAGGLGGYVGAAGSWSELEPAGRGRSMFHSETRFLGWRAPAAGLATGHSPARDTQARAKAHATTPTNLAIPLHVRPHWCCSVRLIHGRLLGIQVPIFVWGEGVEGAQFPRFYMKLTGAIWV